MKKALTIAGSDCSGGAGIQADLKTFSALGVYGMSVITSVVAENTVRVLSYQEISTEVIEEQLEAVFEDIFPDVVKIGMVSCKKSMRTVAQALRKWQPETVVLAPVMYAKNGAPLMKSNAIETLIEELLPLATLITPNIPEAEKICGVKIHTIEEMKKAAKEIFDGCQSAVLIKGGHKLGEATDVLYDGREYVFFTAERIDTKNTHGTGCTFSSAIAAQLALGYPLKQAISIAKDYITAAIQSSLPIGAGHGPTYHFHSFYPNKQQEDQKNEDFSF